MFRKAEGCDAGTCVEVDLTNSASSGGGVRVRDSKDPDSPILTFTKDEWRVFVAGVKNGEFDA